MSAQHPLSIVVIGAGMTGLITAVLLARDGHQVTVLDRDKAEPPPAPEMAWHAWTRPGVSQFRQPHLMLPRWYQEMSREVPELLVGLVQEGAAQVNTVHLQPDSVTHGWQPGDEQFDTVTARRPVLEAALSQLATVQAGLTVRRGSKVTGLLSASRGDVPHVVGVQTSTTELIADLVVDAAGRRTPVPGWVRAWGGPAPVETRSQGGFVYYSRHYRTAGGRTPVGPGPILSHLPSMSVVAFPSDLGSRAIVLAVSAQDRPLRILREPRAWLAAVGCSPVAAHWIAQGEAITGVTPMAGIDDVQRSYLRAGHPVITGLVAVGDACATTDPSLGRGATLGLLQACTLRDVLSAAPRDPREQIHRFAEASAQRVAPWMELTLQFTRHRLAEMNDDIAGSPYQTDDPTWPMSTALACGADHDPVLTRAYGRIGGLLAAPPDVFADPLTQQRLAPYVHGPRYSPSGPTRADLLNATGQESP